MTVTFQALRETGPDSCPDGDADFGPVFLAKNRRLILLLSSRIASKVHYKTNLEVSAVIA